MGRGKPSPASHLQNTKSHGSRDCFLYEIAVIELIYGPLNAASVVIYADCMQQI